MGRNARLTLAVYGCIVLLALACVPKFALPAEDAAILFQYSRNLALHGTISYLGSGPPVEGATDFAYMLLIAAGYPLGLDPFVTTALLNVVSAVGLAIVLLSLAGIRASVGNLLTVVGTYGLLPQIFAALSGFAVLPDAFLLASTVFLVTRGRLPSASFVGFLFCLFRPDAVLFVVPLLGWPLVLHRSRRDAVATALFFVLPSLCYFVWRWTYFHEFFPLPFLVKSDTSRVFGIIAASSFRRSLSYLGFAGALLVVVSRGKRLLGGWLLLPLLLVPTLFYWTMRLDQNVAGRFFYYIPLGAAILSAINWQRVREKRLIVLFAGLAAWLVLLAFPLVRELRSFRDLQFPNVQRVAARLHDVKPQGTLLVSEAGLLPYYSGWPTIDAWGLNTPRFAHHFIQPSEVEAVAADAVVLHPDLEESCISQADWSSAYRDRTWSHLTRNLVLGADPARYELWVLPYGSEYYRRRNRLGPGEGDRECWLLLKNSPVHDQIASALQANRAVPPAMAREAERQRRTASLLRNDKQNGK